ncbi:MAG: sporulation transcriptional regulator SpoIIID [Roseburia sp.]|nr:sporulation transcriptional regulator SpoIIID [Roseburia sp.]
MKSHIEKRAMEIAGYIIDSNATIRQAAKHFAIAPSF